MAGKRGRLESNDDDGFVVDDPNADAPQSNRKKAKNGNSGNVIKRSEGKSEVSTSMQKDEDGNEYWEVCSCYGFIEHKSLEVPPTDNKLRPYSDLEASQSADIKLQGEVHGKHKGVLREGWKASTREEGSRNPRL